MTVADCAKEWRMGQPRIVTRLKDNARLLDARTLEGDELILVEKRFREVLEEK